MTVLVPGDRYVPWRDRVTGSWTLEPLKHHVSVNQESLPENTPDSFEFRYVDISTVGGDGFIGETEILSFGDAPSRARRVPQSGDTLVSTVRTYLKAIAFVENAEGIVCSTGFAVLHPRPWVFPRFLYYWVRSTYFVDEVCARSVGVSYPAIGPSELGSLPFPRLPLPAQRAIAEGLDNRLTALGKLAGAVSSLVEQGGGLGGHLGEYRDALVTLAVTGQIDLRHHVKEAS